MILSLGIDGVDGETNVSMQAPSAKSLLDFLQKHDHEGSSIGLTISVDNPEEAYAILRLLQEIQEVKQSECL
jgi:hypothetical protein